MSMIHKFLVIGFMYCITLSSAWSNPTFNTKPKLSGTVSGKIVETMNAGGYTYVGVKSPDGQLVWAAGPKTNLLKGQSIRFDKATVMRGFKSPTLNRTFETIYFTTALQVTGSANVSSKVHGANAVPHVASSKSEKLNLTINNYTVEQLFKQSNALSGKQVILQGKVVKFNAGIMGKNWLHIQDGSGAPMSKTHDITVTTDADVSVGDLVLIKGTLVTNKDFGAGYRYTAIIEDASVTKK